MVFVFAGEAAQLVVAIALELVMMLVEAHLRPFVLPEDDLLQLVMRAQIVVLYLTALLIQMPSAEPGFLAQVRPAREHHPPRPRGGATATNAGA